MLKNEYQMIYCDRFFTLKYQYWYNLKGPVSIGLKLENAVVSVNINKYYNYKTCLYHNYTLLHRRKYNQSQ